jgi:predicted nucleic acid-binding protein
MQLADRARASGVTVPLADLLIFACAQIHGLEVAHDDTHFDELMTLEA